MAVGNISINAVINVNYETESSRIVHSLKMVSDVTSLMFSILYFVNLIIIIIAYETTNDKVTYSNIMFNNTDPFCDPSRKEQGSGVFSRGLTRL